MARALGRLPRDLVIWGIEGGEWGFGESLTPAVDQAADEVVRRIVAEIR
jgi:hydrogenase maturation protease